MTLSNRTRITLALFIVLATGGGAAWAQNARFGGRVVDLQGEPVAEVSITLRNLDNGQTVRIESDDDGRYFRRGLPIGMYEITFEKDGFVSTRDQRRLGSGQTNHDAVIERVRLSTSPTSSPEYLAAFAAYQEGDRETVIDVLTPLVEREPDFVAAHVLLARSHFELGHWPEAIAGYERALELDSEIAVAYLDLGVSRVELGDLEGAEESFERALDLQPDDAAVHYNIGAIYVRADRIDDAIVYLTRATVLDPEHAVAHKALAFALVRREDTEGAARHLARYLELEPSAPDAAEMAALLEQLRGG